MKSLVTTAASPRLRGRKLWGMRLGALLLPLVVLGGLECSFRLAGAYKAEDWDNPYVSYDKNSVPFPDWDQIIQRPKPSGVVRIVALGGSTTYGLGVDEPFAVQVQQQLTAQIPGRRIEVINGGVPAIGSHRVFEVLKRAAAFDVDFAIVFLGHNEFLEDIYFDPRGISARTERLGRFVRQFRVANWLRSLAPNAWCAYRPRLQTHFLGNTHFPLIHSPEQYQARLNFFDANVRRMIAFARARKIKIIFMPEVPNLLCAPGDSVHGPDYARDSSAWDEQFVRVNNMVRTALADANWDASDHSVQSKALLESVDRLCALDDQFAMAHFLRGLALLRTGRVDLGLEALLAANLRDRRGDRSNSEVMDRLTQVCKEENVPCVDVRGEFYARLPLDFRKMRLRESPELFLDHCHPTLLGHRIIATVFTESLLSQIK